MLHWRGDKNEAWGQNNKDNNKQIKFTSHINFKNTYKNITIISEVVNDSGFILGRFAWDITKTLVSPEVYFYYQLKNVFLCANIDDS